MKKTFCTFGMSESWFWFTILGNAHLSKLSFSDIEKNCHLVISKEWTEYFYTKDRHLWWIVLTRPRTFTQSHLQKTMFSWKIVFTTCLGSKHVKNIQNIRVSIVFVDDNFTNYREISFSKSCCSNLVEWIVYK